MYVFVLPATLWISRTKLGERPSVLGLGRRYTAADRSAATTPATSGASS